MEQNNLIEALSKNVLDEQIVNAIQLLKDSDKYYPNDQLIQIANKTPMNTSNKDIRIDQAYFFALGQLYQTHNSKSLDLFIEMMIKDFQSQYLKYKELHDNTKEPYEKSTYYGLMSAYSNIVFDLSTLSFVLLTTSSLFSISLVSTISLSVMSSSFFSS